MNKTFRQIFQQQRQISSSLATHWGYHIPTNPIDTNHKRTNSNKIPNVANINMLRLVNKIPKTQRILQIQDQIKAIQNGRLLAKYAQERDKFPMDRQEISPVMKLMQEKIKEYNFIVNHNHLNRQYKEQTRKIMKINRDRTEILIESLEREEEKLKDGNLRTQIKINKHLTQLYKSYKGNLKKNFSPQNRAFKTKTMLSEPAKSVTDDVKREQIATLEPPKREGRSNTNTKSDKVLQLNNQTGKDFIHHTEVQTPPNHANHPFFYGNLTDRPLRESSHHRRQRLQKTLHSPFAENQTLNQYRTIQKKNKNDFDVLDLFKHKLQQRRAKSLVKTVRQPHQKHHHKYIHQQSIIPPATERAERVYDQIIAENRQKYELQRSILAELLKKRHSKFNRVGASRVLIKYNEQQHAKQLLKGEPNKNNHSKISNPTQQNLLSRSQQNESQDEHYQRMCKNQKVNLLLKHNHN